MFCAGADLKAMMSAPDPGDDYAKRVAEDAGLAWRALLRHYRLTKPLIAAVEGPAIAGGTEILQATDIRVAGESATFGVAEVRRGLFPLGGSTVRLRRQLHYTVAADLLLTGRTITAREALDYGLIGHVVPDGTALEKAHEIADAICGERSARGQGSAPLAARDRGRAGGRGAQDRARDRPADLRDRGRQGRPDRLRREAPRQLHRPLTSSV